MAETEDVVRNAFEEWAQADNRRLEPNECEVDDRTPGNNHYYEDDTTNQAYIGWCAAWNHRPPDPVVAELVEGLNDMTRRFEARLGVAHGTRYSMADELATLRTARALIAKHAVKKEKVHG